MRVTAKGQVTIPQHIRVKLGITPNSEVDFIEENDRVFVVKRNEIDANSNKFRPFRGVATVKMTTEEIMSLIRGDQ
jgi:AbrB family looped-hinge helix DNA binding protein